MPNLEVIAAIEKNKKLIKDDGDLGRNTSCINDLVVASAGNDKRISLWRKNGHGHVEVGELPH